MKRTIALLLVLVTLLSLVACGAPSAPADDQPASTDNQPQHTHSYGLWRIITQPTLKQSGVKQRICVCGERENAEVPSKFDELSAFMMDNADDYDDGSYTVRENAKEFGLACKLIYPGYSVSGGLWNIALTFNPSTKTTIFLISYGSVSSMLNSLAISVQDGVVVSRYDYVYDSKNATGSYTDRIYGSIYPASLNSSTTLNYTSYSAGSGAFKYFVEDYQRYACGYAKQLVIFFNAYFKSKGLLLTMTDFGFSE